MKDLVVFGTGLMAEMAEFYFSHDTDRRVVAFTLDGAYVREDNFCSRPVVPFETLVHSLPPSRNDVFVAVGYTRLNAVRAERLGLARERGYGIASYLSSRAYAFPGFQPRANCFILENATIQPFVEIGENVVIWSGGHVGHHSTIMDDVYLAPEVAISGKVTIGAGSFVGTNATIRDHVTIGERSVIGAGALVLEDQPAYSVVKGLADQPFRVDGTHRHK